MKPIYVVTLVLIFSSVTILTTLAIWETTTAKPTIEIQTDDLLLELSKLTQEQIRITKILEELNEKSQKREVIKETLLEPIPQNTPQELLEEVIPVQKKWSDSEIGIWDFVTKNHGKYQENIHRVKEFNPPFYLNHIHGVEELTYYFLDSIAKTYANITIQEINRIDLAFQNIFAYLPIGLSYTIDAKVAGVRNTVAICSKCRAVISVTIPVYLNATELNPTLLQVGKVQARVYDPTVRVNFVTTIFNVSSVIERQSEYIRSVYEYDKNIQWIVVEYENNLDDPLDTGVEEMVSSYPFPTKYIRLPGAFSRVEGLNVGGMAVENPDEILFFLDADMYFPKTFSQAIRSRVVQGSQAFYPVCYSFNEDGSPPNTENGFYREGGLGNMGMYQSDFVKYKWYKNGGLTSWGNEDNNMFRVLSNNNITLFRTYEPFFFHIYHPPRSWKLFIY